jgi:hypothetical protein
MGGKIVKGVREKRGKCEVKRRKDGRKRGDLS